jgi:acyl-CoA dehydrogenase
MYHAQEQLHSFLRNFPNRPVAFLLRCFIFPRGRTYSAPSDELGRRVVQLITHSGEARDRLCAQAYTTLEPGNPLGLLQEALLLSEEMEPLEKKLRQAHKEGLIQSSYLGHQIDEAEVADIINADDASRMRDYHQKVLSLMAVDDFAPEDIRRRSADNVGDTKIAASKKKPLGKKKVSARKPAKKTAARTHKHEE